MSQEYNTVEMAIARGAKVSAVNLAEALTKVADKDGDPRAVMAAILNASLWRKSFQVAAFDTDDAIEAAELRPETRAFGLSLGDRACLALALRERLPVLTTDRIWSRLDLDIDIQLIR